MRHTHNIPLVERMFEMSDICFSGNFCHHNDICSSL
nr:MAG TPA: hypothetical protein [Caudoviricetes sp.]